MPALDAMDEQQAYVFLSQQLARLSCEQEYELRHEDYTNEMPQSGERIRGREAMRAFQEAYPTPSAIQVRRVLARPGLWVVEGVNDYGDSVSRMVDIIELRDGKILRETRYYADPFEAPTWRSQWVERFDP
jgi:hypothetical protein